MSSWIEVRIPATLIQSPRAQWHAILTHYRFVLGDYQFRRTLFVRRFVYR